MDFNDGFPKHVVRFLVPVLGKTDRMKFFTGLENLADHPEFSQMDEAKKIAVIEMWLNTRKGDLLEKKQNERN